MKLGWFRTYHRQCDDCVEISTEDRRARIGPYWIRRIRRCGGHDVDFNYSLMEGHDGPSVRLIRICTSTYHGETVHVHDETKPGSNPAPTQTKCWPGSLGIMRGKIDMIIAETDEYELMRWRAPRWAHVLNN